MSSQIKKVLTIVSIAAFAVVLITGSALADPITPGTGNSSVDSGVDSGSRLSRMIDYMGAEHWGEMIQRMNQLHGPEFTGRMLQQMNEPRFSHSDQHIGSGSMMEGGFNGMMGHHLGNQMGSGFQHDGPDHNSGHSVGPGFSGSMMNRNFGH